MTVIAIDPGDKKSAIVHYDPAIKTVIESRCADNWAVLEWLRQQDHGHFPFPILIVEMIASYGMPVGQEVFETCVWVGRFIQAWCPDTAQMLYRKDVKMHLCGTTRAKDPNVRAALLDKFGGSRACGTKRQPGPLYGISGDKWAALGVAVTWAETQCAQRQTPDLFAGVVA